MTRKQAVVRGSLGFFYASLMVFTTVVLGTRWLYSNLKEAGAYSVWALEFIFFAGIILARMFRVPVWPFAGIFGASFAAYVIGWCAVYFAITNRVGELIASVAGPFLMSVAAIGITKSRGHFLKAFTALTTGHTIGYFLGSLLFESVGKAAGMMLWGICYGFGFGAGIGYTAHLLLEPHSRPEPTRSAS